MDYQALKAELASGHPDTGAYDVSDEIAKNQLNAINRPANGGVDQMLTYLVTHKNRTNTGGDLVGTAILGRLQHASESAVGSDPFNQQGGYTLALSEKHAATCFLNLVMSPNLDTVNFLDTELDIFYTEVENAGIWKGADSTVLKGYSQNQQSRARELGFGFVRVGDVEYARSLP